jgi:hypothetical protein
VVEKTSSNKGLFGGFKKKTKSLPTKEIHFSSYKNRYYACSPLLGY